MTGIPEYNRPMFAKVAAALRAEGHCVYNPGETLKDGVWSYDEYLAHDLAVIEEEDFHVLVQLPGWEKSNGAVKEFKKACDVGSPALVQATEDIPALVETIKMLNNAMKKQTKRTA